MSSAFTPVGHEGAPHTGCSVEGCERVHFARTLCRMHYVRWMKHGSTDLPPRPKAEPWRDRFARRYAECHRVGECFEWPAGRNEDGYGQFSINRKTLVASRVSWVYFNGSIPEGVLIRHRCDNPPCVRIEHLELGSPKQNTGDALDRGRWAWGERNGDAHLTNEQVVEIVRAIREGSSQRSLASQYGVGQSTIGRISRGESWSTVTGIQR